MSALFLVLWVAALVLWFYGLGPFLRVRTYLAKNRTDTLQPFTPLAGAWHDKEHPAHDDARKAVYAYGGFVACVLIGLLIGYFTFPRH